MTDPAGSAFIEVRVAEMKQLFNSIDPSPFNERDLDPRAEEFIVNWASDLPRKAPLSLVVHLERSTDPRADEAVLRDAIRQYFGERASVSRRQLRELFRRGRISLVIGLAFVALAIGASELVGRWLEPGGMIEVFHASLMIGGWVAMWRPLELFLYDWWPVRAEARLYDRLALMPVSVNQAAG